MLEILITGDLKSGKTAVAMAIATYLRACGWQVRLAESELADARFFSPMLGQAQTDASAWAAILHSMADAAHVDSVVTIDTQQRRRNGTLGRRGSEIQPRGYAKTLEPAEEKA